MKQSEGNRGTFFAVLAVTVFFHYFVLTNFSVGASEKFTGQVTQVKQVRRGLFPEVEVNFEVSQLLNGSIVKEQKTIKAAASIANQFEIGKTYSVKTLKDWICAYTKS